VKVHIVYLPLTHVDQLSRRRYQKLFLPVLLLLTHGENSGVSGRIKERDKTFVNYVISGLKWRHIISEKWSISILVFSENAFVLGKCFSENAFCFREMLFRKCSL
jgi:hypothetical protein